MLKAAPPVEGLPSAGVGGVEGGQQEVEAGLGKQEVL